MRGMSERMMSWKRRKETRGVWEAKRLAAIWNEREMD